jgi:hypothetical protein
MKSIYSGGGVKTTCKQFKKEGTKANPTRRVTATLLPATTAVVLARGETFGFREPDIVEVS